MQGIRKRSVLNSALILAGILLFLVFRNNNSTAGKIIGSIGAVTAGIALIRIIFDLNDIYHDRINSAVNRKGANASLGFGRYLIHGSFFIGTLLMLREINKLDNTLHGQHLFFISALAGIVVTAIINLAVFKKKKYLFVNDRNCYELLLGLPLAMVMLLPAVASSINQAFAAKEVICRPYRVEKKSGIGRYEQPVIKCYIDNGIERFIVTDEFSDSIDEGDTVHLCVSMGFFNYEFVKEFEIDNDPE